MDEEAIAGVVRSLVGAPVEVMVDEENAYPRYVVMWNAASGLKKVELAIDLLELCRDPLKAVEKEIGEILHDDARAIRQDSGAVSA
jgi:hypothetical protein